MKLNDWSVRMTGDAYTAPEQRRQVLAGAVFGHPKFPYGHRIVTSAIIGQRDGKVLTESGSEYELDQPEALYKEMYLDCHKRLFDTLPYLPKEV